MHIKLKNRLIKHFGSVENIPKELRPLIDSIDQAYQEIDKDRKKLKKAIKTQQTDPKPTPVSATQVEQFSETVGYMFDKELAQPVPIDESINGENGVALPIQLRNQTMGMLNIEFENDYLAEETLPLIEQVSERLALAIDNARLFNESQSALSRTNALLQISRTAITFEKLADLLQSVAEIAADTLPANRTIVMTFDAKSETISHIATAGFGKKASPSLPYQALQNGLLGWAIRERKVALTTINDPHPEEGAAAQKQKELLNAGSLIIAPLSTRDQVFGIIAAINDPQSNDLTQSDADLLIAMASQVATALENAELFERQEARVAELTTLFDGSQAFANAPLDLREIATIISQEFVQLTGGDSCGLALYSPEADTMNFLANVFLKNGSVIIDETPEKWNYRLSDFPYTQEIFNSLSATVAHSSDPDSKAKSLEYLQETGVRSLLTIPLAAKGQAFGIIEIDFYDDEPLFSSDQINLFSTLANQAAATLDNARLFQVQQLRAIELQTAAEVSRAASSILDPGQLLSETAQIILDRFDLYYAGIFLVDETNEWAELRAGTGEAGRIQIERRHKLKIGGESMIGRCVSDGKAHISQSTVAAENRYKNPILPDTQSEMALPLVSRGETIGAMTIQSVRAAAFSEDNVTTLQTMADQLANAIQNANLYERAQLQNDELDILNQMGQDLTSILDEGGIYQKLLDSSRQLLPFTSFMIAIYNEELDEVSFPLVWENGEYLSVTPRSKSSGLTGYVIETKKPLLIPDDLPGTSKKLGIDYQTQGTPAKSWLGVPLSIGREVLGIISVQSTSTPGLYNERHQDLLTSIANQTANALQNAQLFEQVQSALSTTEAQYSASAAFNVAQSYADILATFQTSTNSEDGKSSIVLFDHPSTSQKIPKMSIPIARSWGEGHGWSSTDGLPFPDYANRSQITLITDIRTDSRLPEDFRKALLEGVQVKAALIIPLVAGRQWIGYINIFYPDPIEVSDAQLRQYMSLAGQAAVAIQGLRSLENAQQSAAEAQKRSEELAIINRVVSSVTNAFNLTEGLEIIAKELVHATNADRAGITLLDEDKSSLTLVADYTISKSKHKSQIGLRIPVGKNTSSERVIKTKKPLFLEDAQSDPLLADLHEVFKEIGIKSMMIFPIVTNNEVIGTIGLDILEDNVSFTAGEQELTETILLQAATAIQNTRLFEQTQTALQETETLYNAGSEMNAAQSYDDVLRTMQVITNAEDGRSSILLFDKSSATKRRPARAIPVAQSWGLDTSHGWSSMKDGDLPFPNYVQRNQPTIISDTKTDPRLPDDFRKLLVENVKAEGMILLPLIAGQQWIGYINILFPQPIQLAESQVRQYMALAGQAAVAIQSIRSLENAQQSAAEAQKRSEELAIINRVVSSVANAFDLTEGLGIVAKELVEASGADRAGVALMNEDQSALTVVVDYSESDKDGKDSFVGLQIPVKGNLSTEKVIRTKKPLYIKEAQTDPIVAALHEQFKELGIKSMMIFPILANNEIIGTIGLDIFEDNERFISDEQDLSETILLQAATAIQNTQLFEQTQIALQETETLYEAGGEMNIAQSYDEVLAILRKYTVLGHESARFSVIGFFDQPWVGDDVPQWYRHIAQWTSPTYKKPLSIRYPVASWPGVQALLRSDTVMVASELDTNPTFTGDPFVATNKEFQLIKDLILAPVLNGTSWEGHIFTAFNEHVQVSPAALRQLDALTRQASTSIQKIRLLAETERRAAQLQTAAEIARDASGSLNLDELLPRAVNFIRDRFGYYHASIFLMDDSRENAVVRASTGEAGTELIARGHRLAMGSQSIIGTVTYTKEHLVINDVSQDPIHHLNPLLPDTKAELGIPMLVGDRVIGALDVQSTEVNAFGPDDIAVLQTLADQIAVSVDNSRSYQLAQDAFQETRKRVQEVTTLFEVGRTLTNASLQVEDITHIIAENMVSALGAGVYSCSIAIHDSETNEMQTLVDYVKEDETDVFVFAEDPTKWDFNLDDYPATKKVFETSEPLLIKDDDPDSDPAEQAYLDSVNANALLILPLASKGEVFGISEIKKLKGHEFSQDEINLVSAIANQASAALDNARLYETQLETAKQLRELDKLKNEFLASMSHELRTPLNSIIGFSRVILKGIDGPITDLQEQDLTAIYNSGQHLLGLINDILDLSRIEAGKMELSLEELEIETIITSVMSTARGLTKEKPIQLITNIDENLPKIKADATRIRQVLLNLIQNATKFTAEGTITVRAELTKNEELRDVIKVSVTDTGIGISEVGQKRLFRAFSQVDSSTTRKYGGTGLGLSISKNLMEMHGGHIGVTSKEGEGSTFYFWLPIMDDALHPQIKIMEDEPLLDGEHRIVLAIDDDTRIIALYERYLTNQGYTVVPLSDPTKAVEQAIELKPYAITLDVMMPNQDGWLVIQELKSHPETKDIPVIFCTIIEDQAKGFSLGATDYLMKPILEEDLVNAIARLQLKRNIHNILVIDDDPNALRLVEKILQDVAEYNVIAIAGGEKGLEAIQTLKPDAIILDLSMPGLDGFKIIETMQEDEELKGIPIIILTGQDLNKQQQKLVSTYAQSTFHKASFEEQSFRENLEKTLLNQNGNDK